MRLLQIAAGATALLGAGMPLFNASLLFVVLC